MTDPNPLTIIGFILVFLAGLITRAQMRKQKHNGHSKYQVVLPWIIAIACFIVGGILVFLF